MDIQVNEARRSPNELNLTEIFSKTHYNTIVKNQRQRDY